MLRLPDEADLLARFRAWAGADERVRALVLTSTRARPGGPVDLLSDYDLIVAARDPAPFVADDAWTRAFGEPLVRWGDDAELRGLRTWFRGVVYADGLKVDYSLWPVELLDRVPDGPPLDVLDVGYRVLLDKDGRTARWPPPTHRAHVPSPPDAAGYRALVEEFFWSATYVAKALWRGELVFARFELEVDCRTGALRKLLEWRLELDHGWALKPGVRGRGLERLLPDDLRRELESTYLGGGADETWESLGRLSDLFRRVAVEVGTALGHPYPEEVDAAVRAYLAEIRALTAAAGS